MSSQSLREKYWSQMLKLQAMPEDTDEQYKLKVEKATHLYSLLNGRTFPISIPEFNDKGRPRFVSELLQMLYNTVTYIYGTEEGYV